MPFKGKIAAATIGAVKAGRIHGFNFAADACNWNQIVAIESPSNHACFRIDEHVCSLW